MRKLLRQKAKWLLPVSTLLLIGFLFADLLNRQSERSNPNSLRAQLLQEDALVELSQWSFRFQKCDYQNQPTKCEHLSLKPELLSLPNPNSIRSLISQTYPGANLAVGEYTFNEGELEWLKKKEGQMVTFSIPHSVQFALFVFVGKRVYNATGVGVHSVVHIPAADLIAIKHLRVEYEFDHLAWFGPPDLPPALSTPEASTTYLSLREKQVGSANLARQIHIGFPFLIAAISLVLDHSLAFGLLSIFGASQAVSSFLTFLSDIGVGLGSGWTVVSFAVNGLAFATLLILVLELTELRVLKRRTEWLFTFGSTVAFGAVSQLGAELILKIDSYAEMISTGVGVVLVGIGLGRILAKRRESKKRTTDLPEESNPSNVGGVSDVIKALRMSLAGVGLLVHCVANAQDLFLIQTDSFRDSLDWKHNILFPALISACLLEVGSTSRKMFVFARQMVDKALIEKDLEVGKIVQQRMLPQRKAIKAGWQWRSVYLPATALAGDWYDVRALKLACGREILVACLADVTGHGVGAALATSVISSHWGLWCDELQKTDTHEETIDLEHNLGLAPQRINRGLLALRQNENCTAIFIILDRDSMTVTLASAGHPGALISNGRSLEYFTSQGNRLGVDGTESVWPVASRPLQPNEHITIYSDGIIPVGKTVSAWAAHLKRTLRKNKDTELKDCLVKQLKDNRRDFRQDRRNEDDMTVVAIWPQEAADKSEKVAKNWCRSFHLLKKQEPAFDPSIFDCGRPR